MKDAEIVRDALAWVGTEDIGSQGPNDEIRLPALAALERLESQNQALQEALDEIRDRSTCPNHPTCPHGCESIANAALNALSPTQETDPE